jgi:hypothetical protein
MRVFNMKLFTPYLPMIAAFFLGFVLAYVMVSNSMEGFQTAMTKPMVCTSCGENTCPPVPDLNKYVLKTSVPPPTKCPDMSQYMLKTECPPVPDLSQYVLKTSIPTPEPVIIDTSSCNKRECGDCPPCPRPRCPETKCPPPTVCPACPPCPRQTCPQTTVKCKAEESPSTPVRPFLAPLNMSSFGM